MNAIALWCVATALLVVAELMTGTFYLLMVAIGCAAAAIVATSGAGIAAQLAMGAGVGIVATLVLRQTRWGRRQLAGDATRNRDVILDIGEVVQVDAWTDRTADVRYRGARWTAELEAGATPVAGAQVIKAVRGSTLVVAPLG